MGLRYNMLVPPRPKVEMDNTLKEQIANILQIANVALRVVFLLFLPCFLLSSRPVPAAVLTLETSEMSAIFFHNQ